MSSFLSRHPWLALVALACVAFSATGCGGGGGAGNGGAAAPKYVIAVIPKGRTHEFWQSIERGARRAAADLTAQGLPVEVLYEGPINESEAVSQINLVRQMVNSRGARGLVLAPQDSKRMVSVVKDTVEAGVPVVIIDSGLDSPDLYVKYVATDNYNGGKLAAQHLLDTLAKQGNKAPRLFLFRYAVGSESTEQREKGFLDHVNAEIAKQKKAGLTDTITLVGEEYAGATVTEAQKKAGQLLPNYKGKFDGVFAVNESATSGLLNAMRNLEVKGVAVMGFDTSAPLLQALRQGEVIGLIAQDPYRMGYTGVYTLVRHLEGDDVAADGKNLSTGEYLITKQNIDAQKIGELFDPRFQEKRKLQPPAFAPKKTKK